MPGEHERRDAAPRMPVDYPRTRLEYALFYAGMGWHVLPVDPAGKRPLVDPVLGAQVPGAIHGVHDATTDPAQIHAWWDKWPDANIGVSMGRVSGIVAIDIDPRNGGDDSWAALQRELGPLPDTVEAITGGGGRHLLFMHPSGEELPKRKLRPGIDVISNGGYILVEPSLHPSGTAYAWEGSSSPVEGVAVAYLTQPLLELLRAPPAAPPGTSASELPADERLQRELRAALCYLDPDDYDTWIRAGHALRELGDAGRALWEEWSQRSAKWRPGDAARWATFKPQRTGYQAIFAQAQRAGWINPIGQAMPADTAPLTAPANDTLELEPIPAGLLADRTLPALQWVLPNWIPKGYVTALYADGGSGKTTLAQQLATCLALGKPFLGLEAKPARTLMVLCEDDEPAVHRRQADVNRWAECSYRDLADRVKFLPRLAEPTFLALQQRDGQWQWTAFMHALVTLCERDRPDLVIIDSLADIYPANENDRAAVSSFAVCTLVELAKRTGAAVLVLGHTNKSAAGAGGYSGSTAWNAKVKSRLHLHTNPETRNHLTLTVEKSNNAPVGEAIELWRHGPILMRYDDVPSVLRESGVESLADEVFLTTLQVLLGQGRRVSDARQGGRWAPKIIVDHLRQQGGKSMSWKYEDMEAAMERLFAREAIQIHIDDRKGSRWIEPTEERKCA